MITAWTIHIVDDDEAVRTSLHFALEATGHRVAAYDGAQDFLAREHREPGILVCDVRMPGMNGIELTRRIKHDLPEMPVILVTGHADATLRTEAVNAGADIMLEKPVDLMTLLGEISRLAEKLA